MAQSGNGKHSGRLAASTVDAISALDSLWAQIDAARARTERASGTRPPGSVNVTEFAKRYQMTWQAASYKLMAMVKAGEMDVQMCYGPSDNGRIVAQRYFTLRGK